jgi:hypothetical protein
MLLEWAFSTETHMVMQVMPVGSFISSLQILKGNDH